MLSMDLHSNLYPVIPSSTILPAFPKSEQITGVPTANASTILIGKPSYHCVAIIRALLFVIVFRASSLDTSPCNSIFTEFFLTNVLHQSSIGPVPQTINFGASSPITFHASKRRSIPFNLSNLPAKTN